MEGMWAAYAPVIFTVFKLQHCPQAELDEHPFTCSLCGHIKDLIIS